MSISGHQSQSWPWRFFAPPGALRRLRALPGAFAGLLLLTGIGIGPIVLAPVSVLNAISIWDKYRVATGVLYGAGARQTLDVYAPEPRRAQAPIAVFFYGGSWQGGDKSIYRFVGAALAARGVVTVIPDYRVYPEVRFPG